jgi:hypothetical protein
LCAGSVAFLKQKQYAAYVLRLIENQRIVWLPGAAARQPAASPEPKAAFFAKASEKKERQHAIFCAPKADV